MIRIEIKCNKCGMAGDYSEGPNRWKAHQMRNRLKKTYGWHVDLDGGRDYCSFCWEKIQMNRKNKKI